MHTFLISLNVSAIVINTSSQLQFPCITNICWGFLRCPRPCGSQYTCLHALAEDLGRLAVRGRVEKAATHIMIGDFIAWNPTTQIFESSSHLREGKYLPLTLSVMLNRRDRRIFTVQTRSGATITQLYSAERLSNYKLSRLPLLYVPVI